MVVTHNRRDLLVETLPRHLASMADEPADGQPTVLVIDNGSTDGTAAAAAVFPSVGVVALDRNVGASGRNVGAALATTRYVAFSDDDSWWDPGAVAGACDVLDAHPSVALVTGRVLVGEKGVPDPSNRQLAEGAAVAGGSSVHGFLACAAVVRRNVMMSTGGYPVELGIGGEEELAALDLMAGGWQLVYRSELVVRHRPELAGERPGRTVMQARNAIAVALARRTLSGGVGAVWRALASVPAGLRLRTLRSAAGIVTWAVRNRAPVPPSVDAAFRP